MAGYVISQRTLGQLFLDDKMVAKDLDRGLNWLKKAAAQSHAPAERLLAIIYRHGIGVPQDLKLAATLYLRAAQAGDVTAQGNLGTMYANGDAVPQNVVLAYALFSLAARGGESIGLENLGNLASRLTIEQRQEGEQISREWKLGSALPTKTVVDGRMGQFTDVNIVSVIEPLRVIGSELSVGDISTLELILRTQGAELFTIIGSANDRLWSEFVLLGWAVELAPSQADATISAKRFSLTAVGSPWLGILFAAIMGDRQRQATA
jgi:uncharacterized protein